MTTIRIPVNLSPILSPNRSNRTPKNAIYGEQKRLKQKTIKACEETIDLNDPVACFQDASWPILLHVIVARGKNRKPLDDDNMVASLKYMQDGIASALGINDRYIHILRPIIQVRDPDGVGYIQVSITPSGGSDD